MAQYPSQDAGSQDGPKNPLKGTSMKFLVLSFERPVRGGYWELRFRGDPQWHAGVDPFSVETYACASNLLAFLATV